MKSCRNKIWSQSLKFPPSQYKPAVSHNLIYEMKLAVLLPQGLLLLQNDRLRINTRAMKYQVLRFVQQVV